MGLPASLAGSFAGIAIIFSAIIVYSIYGRYKMKKRDLEANIPPPWRPPPPDKPRLRRGPSWVSQGSLWLDPREKDRQRREKRRDAANVYQHSMAQVDESDIPSPGHLLHAVVRDKHVKDPSKYVSYSHPAKGKEREHHGQHRSYRYGETRGAGTSSQNTHRGYSDRRAASASREHRYKEPRRPLPVVQNPNSSDYRYDAVPRPYRVGMAQQPVQAQYVDVERSHKAAQSRVRSVYLPAN